jgi:hypothetical protein
MASLIPIDVMPFNCCGYYEAAYDVKEVKEFGGQAKLKEYWEVRSHNICLQSSENSSSV